MFKKEMLIQYAFGVELMPDQCCVVNTGLPSARYQMLAEVVTVGLFASPPLTYPLHHHIYEVCQMLSWRTKNGPHFINFLDTVTNVVPLCSVHQAPSYVPIVTFLAPFPT